MTTPDLPLFTQKLLEWFATNHRPLPWKGEKNPYKIWLSEIILQQTTVRQGLPYFERFVAQYPTVKELADAPEDDVMKLWEGLGYYSRARNLHATAKHITYNLNASFPNSYEGLLTLKGVGSYTAAAIASFAYDLPHAVVDGNVYRVLSRYFGIETPIDMPQAKKQFTDLANELLDTNRPADFNQAMMDFGATQCTPNNPQCSICPLQSTCVAYEKNIVSILPIKSKKMVKRVRFFNYFIINQGDMVYIRKRFDKDIWQDLYEFPLIETTELLENTEGVDSFGFQMSNFKFLSRSQPYIQLLTHQKIIGVFWEFEAKNTFLLDQNQFLKIEKKNLTNFAFPKIVDTYMKKKVLNLF
jgi:A/G-specific adenine glycosylase